MHQVRRMRKIREAMAEIKEMDPGSTLTWYTVRKLCKNKKIRNIEAGNKLLVDLDDLIDFLNCEKRTRE